MNEWMPTLSSSWWSSSSSCNIYSEIYVSGFRLIPFVCLLLRRRDHNQNKKEKAHETSRSFVRMRVTRDAGFVYFLLSVRWNFSYSSAPIFLLGVWTRNVVVFSSSPFVYVLALNDDDNKPWFIHSLSREAKASRVSAWMRCGTRSISCFALRLLDVSRPRLRKTSFHQKSFRLITFLRMRWLSGSPLQREKAVRRVLPLESNQSIWQARPCFHVARIAQSVERVAFNHNVQGSSPCSGVT